MIPLQWSLIAVVAALVLGAWGGYSFEENRWDAAAGRQATAAATLSNKQRTASAKAETIYVDKIQTVNVPVMQVRDRIVRAACPAVSGMRASTGSAVSVPAGNAGQPADGAAQADPNSGLIDGIAADAGACVRNGIQLQQLQALIRANVQSTAAQ